MTFFTDTLSSSTPDLATYAPDFLVKFDGEQLDAERKGDVLTLKVIMSLNEITSAEVTLNNWDDTTVWYKYSEPGGPYVGQTGTVELGYAGQLQSVVSGKINSLAPSFPAAGSPTIRVGILDLMDDLRSNRPGEGQTRQFLNMQYSEIAEEVGGRHGLTVDAVPDGTVHAEILQGHANDAQFLQLLARRASYACFIHIHPDSGEPTLRFGPPTDGTRAASTAEYPLKWGQDLISFEPTLTMSSQVAQVTVRGWNLDTMEEIVATASAADLAGSGGASGPDNAGGGSGRQDVVIAADVHSQEEADSLARSLLQDRADAYITARGELVGMAQLRPGDNLVLSGLGTRFAGKYHLTGVEHELGAEGFRTRFDARKLREEESA